MAKSNDNNATHGLSGKVNQFVYRQWFGKTVVGKKPRRIAGTPTMNQQTIRLRFRQAASYAKAAIADIATKLFYSSKAEPGQSAYNMALADFFKPPVIDEINLTGYTGQPGNKIIIPVTDDGKVVSVSVKIENPDGSLVEQGNAVLQPDGLHWEYTSTAINTSLAGDMITVTATDLPGHSSVKQTTM